LKQLLVIGGGFAGLWSALGAARRLDDLGIASDAINITLINRDRWHAIRVRNYESDISDARVPLAGLLDPAGIDLVVGTVTAIDCGQRTVSVETADGRHSLSYDRLMVAAGSGLIRPNIPGYDEYAFNIDTWDDANRLDLHLNKLVTQPASEARDTMLVIGAGLTGVELACELPDRLRAIGIERPRIVLIDREAHIGADMGNEAIPVIDQALNALGVECRPGLSLTRLEQDTALFANGTRIAASTVIWTGGVQASPLAALLPVARDSQGRVIVDRFMQVEGLDGVFASGDIAAAPAYDGRMTVMSCQHSRPMGRFGGHNMASDLAGADMIPLEIVQYSTCLDLGPWGAVRTSGWDRRVQGSGAEVKKIKMNTNRNRIYPPRSGTRADLLEAAAAEMQVAAAKP
jgi:NADH dehydrogenase